MENGRLPLGTIRLRGGGFSRAILFHLPGPAFADIDQADFFATRNPRPYLRYSVGNDLLDDRRSKSHFRLPLSLGRVLEMSLLKLRVCCGAGSRKLYSLICGAKFAQPGVRVVQYALQNRFIRGNSFIIIPQFTEGGLTSQRRNPAVRINCA
jgi:hypothetical protein